MIFRIAVLITGLLCLGTVAFFLVAPQARDLRRSAFGSLLALSLLWVCAVCGAVLWVTR